jgi:hypothetical protein
MNETADSRNASPTDGLDRTVVRELCELHPLDMSQLCQKVGLNKTAFSNFLTGRRPMPKAVAPQFLRQIGLTVYGELDPRHCFRFDVGPAEIELAVKWIGRLFPSGGNRIPILKTEVHRVDEDDVEQDTYAAGAVLLSDSIVAVVHDKVHFGDMSWIPGAWKTTGDLAHVQGLRLLDSDRLVTKETVSAAISLIDPVDEPASWASVQHFAEHAGLSPNDVLKILGQAIRDRASTEC